jgi:Leucine-rich repeat (LRR) protein
MTQHKADLIREFIMRYLTNISVKLLIIGVITITFCSERTTFGQDKTHTVHFPKDRSLGILYTRDSGIEGRESWQGWEELGQARGEISIPPDKELRLVMSDNNYQHIAELASLGANDIQNLYIPCRDLRDSDLAYLEGLTGLQSLGLSSGRSYHTCSLTGVGFVYLKGMSSLRNLDILYTMIDDESLAHFKYLTSLESLHLSNNRGISGDGLLHLKNLPLLRSISFHKVPIEDFGLENLKGMRQLESLSLQSTNVTDEGLAHLKGLTGLKHLGLPPNTTDAGLANLSGLSSLERLNISDTKVTDDGLVHLKGLSGLESLSVSGREINGRGLKHLHDLPQLKELKIIMRKVDDEGMEGLKGLTSVTSLSLGDTTISDAGLACVEGLTALEYLNVRNTLITDAGLAYLKGLASLRTLVLMGTRITDAGLANLQNLASLRTLWLQGTDVTDTGLAYLKGLRSLKQLYLSSTQISDVGLVNLKELHSLQYVLLNGTNISGEGLVHLKDLKLLRNLGICVNNLSKGGVGHLKEMTWLHDLTLGEGSLSESVLADLKKALPDCRISVQRVPSRPPKPRRVSPSLLGKPLPGMKDFGVDLPSAEVNDKMILVCFFNMEQRPSRNCITQLAKQAERLKGKGITVVTVHASNIDENTLNEWIKKNNIPFPIGMIQDDEEQTRFNWGVKSLPWLILTNDKHCVVAEGFNLKELDNKLEQLGDK